MRTLEGLTHIGVLLNITSSSSEYFGSDGLESKFEYSDDEIDSSKEFSNEKQKSFLYTFSGLIFIVALIASASFYLLSNKFSHPIQLRKFAVLGGVLAISFGLYSYFTQRTLNKETLANESDDENFPVES